MSRLTEALSGMDERPFRVFPEGGILNLPPPATPRRRWRAIPAMVVLAVAALAIGTALWLAAVTPVTTPTPVSGLEPSSAPSPLPLKGDELFRVTMGQGIDAARRGALHDARRLFERALELNGASAEGWNNLGVVLIRQGDTAAGIAAFRDALRLNPTHAEAHRNLAVALEHQDQPLEATRHYLFFLSLSQQGHPERAEIRRRLGTARIRSDE